MRSVMGETVQNNPSVVTVEGIMKCGEQVYLKRMKEMEFMRIRYKKAKS